MICEFQKTAKSSDIHIQSECKFLGKTVAVDMLLVKLAGHWKYGWFTFEILQSCLKRVTFTVNEGNNYPASLFDTMASKESQSTFPFFTHWYKRGFYFFNQVWYFICPQDPMTLKEKIIKCPADVI